MVNTDFGSLPEWLGIETEAASNLAKTRVPLAAELFLPREVCSELDSESLELAVTSGMFGPPEASCSVLFSSTLFSETPDRGSESVTNEDAQIANDLEGLSATVGSVPKQRYLRSKWFVFVLLVLCRCACFLKTAPFALELAITYGMLLIASYSIPPTRNSSFLAPHCTVFTNCVLFWSGLAVHGILLFSMFTSTLSLLQRGGSDLVPGMTLFSQSWVLSLTALLVVVLSFIVELNLPPLISQWLALTAVALDGVQTCSLFGCEINEQICFLQPTTALTLLLTLFLAALMSETMNYTKLKSYS